MIVTPIAPRPLKAPLLSTTRKFYQVLAEPAPLAGMAYPEGKPWRELQTAGFASIVCLTDARPRYDPSPLHVLHSARFHDLFGGRLPPDPTVEAGMLSEVVAKVFAEMTAGRGVVIHCKGGTGRTGTVIACTLRALGLPTAAILKYMESVNQSRNKSPGWPESVWQKQRVGRQQVLNCPA